MSALPTGAGRFRRSGCGWLIGQPHFGHVGARSDTLAPHSGQFTRAIVPPPGPNGIMILFKNRRALRHQRMPLAVRADRCENRCDSCAVACPHTPYMPGSPSAPDKQSRLFPGSPNTCCISRQLAMIDAKLSLSLAQRVDAACDRFEEECAHRPATAGRGLPRRRAGGGPRRPAWSAARRGNGTAVRRRAVPEGRAGPGTRCRTAGHKPNLAQDGRRLRSPR